MCTSEVYAIFSQINLFYLIEFFIDMQTVRNYRILIVSWLRNKYCKTFIIYL